MYHSCTTPLYPFVYICLKHQTIYIMKKLIFIFLTVLIVACSSDDGGQDDCENIAQLVEQTNIAFSQNQSFETCQAYKEALVVFVNCAPNIDNVEFYESIIETLDCNLF